MTRVLVVDDEPAIVRAITIALTAHDFEVEAAATGKQAVAKASDRTYDLIVLDLGLPDYDGLEVIRRVRSFAATVPIIVLSAWHEIETRVEALDLGADDYLAKPFGMPELLARMRVALRHAGRAQAGKEADDGVLRRGCLTIDCNKREVLVDGKPIRLTRTQFDVLVFLARNPNRVLTHRAITNAVWGPAVDVDPQNLRVVISQIRKRIEPDPGSPRLIRTELSVGYRFEPND